jgi:predicted metal-dependent phosphotriesterase family hydrolase
MSECGERRISRRQALEWLGLSAAAAALPAPSFGQAPAFARGAIIRTLFKDYAPEELAGGATLFHEHISLGADFNDRFRAAAAAVRIANGAPLAGRGGAAASAGAGAPPAGAAAAPANTAPANTAPRGGGPPPPAGPDPMRNVDLMAEELATARREGAACILDAGHPDMGRDLDFVRQASMKSGVPVVAGVGFYSQPFYPKEIAAMSEEQIVQALIRQADEAPGGAFGEIGSWDEITADERKVFRAVGKAHVATNLPIVTHTGIPGKSALEQLDLLEDAGVKPDRVVIGHLGNLVDASVYVHKAICRRGGYVGFDRQGGNGDAQQVPLVMALLEAGFADHLLFSADASRGYGKTLTVFLPKLKAAGASDEVLRRIMVDNPRRFLAFVPKRRRQ